MVNYTEKNVAVLPHFMAAQWGRILQVGPQTASALLTAKVSNSVKDHKQQML